MSKARKKQNRPRGTLEDWMWLTPEQMNKSPKERIYALKSDKWEVIVQWARNGLTKDEIAENMGISRSTLATWCKKCPDIVDALKEARAYAHARVENALYRKAIGYTVKKPTPVRTKVKDRDETGKVIGTHEEVQIVELEEYVPPDMGAIAFYLKNNLPHKYKDKWPDAVDDEQQEAENICLKDFTAAVAKAVIRERGAADGQ